MGSNLSLSCVSLCSVHLRVLMELLIPCFSATTMLGVKSTPKSIQPRLRRSLMMLVKRLQDLVHLLMMMPTQLMMKLKLLLLELFLLCSAIVVQRPYKQLLIRRPTPVLALIVFYASLPTSMLLQHTISCPLMLNTLIKLLSVTSTKLLLVLFSASF